MRGAVELEDVQRAVVELQDGALAWRRGQMAVAPSVRELSEKGPQ